MKLRLKDIIKKISRESMNVEITRGGDGDGDDDVDSSSNF